MAIARVVVELALDRSFDYRIPDALTGRISVGSKVVIPFGKSRRTGYVVALVPKSQRRDLKEILSLADEKPFVNPSLLDLAQWMSDYYCAPLEQVIRAILPGAVRRKGARFKQRLFVKRKQPDNTRDQDLTAKQSQVMELLDSRGGMFLHQVTRDLNISAAPVKALERKGLVSLAAEAQVRDPLAHRTVLPTQPLKLTAEQADAVKTIEACLEAELRTGTASRAGTGRKAVPLPRVVLLYGVTGSGKTEVYLQAIEKVLVRGGGAIVLVPEISLTPQTIERFLGRFGNRLAVLHSHLSEGERHDEWHRIRDGKADIVVGARSAVFAPVSNLGLIVVDEEHETSYKQEESPRYGARDVAVMRGHIESCAVVLGSATPSLESWHNASRGKYRLAQLRNRVDHRRMPVMRVVDMRVEAERAGHAGVFSQDLLDAIQRRLDRAEQTILFLNRRGFATSLICPKCGYVAECDHCSVSYTYHRKAAELRCHICGAVRRVPSRCPGCRDPQFKFAGFGTQRVETIVGKCFPKASIQRMDADMTTRKDAYDRILGDFRVGKIDILIGTQMIAKGLHFPNVTLVGVVYADLSLHLPDFRAGERTFQLLAQVAGRAGRGEIAGEVIVQTYTPFHPAVQAARRVDYEGFAAEEVEFRKQLTYPPYSHLICVELKGASEQRVAFTAETLAKRLAKALPESVEVSDAAPAPLAKAKGLYRFQVMLRHPSVKTMSGPVRTVLGGFARTRDVTVSIDVDAQSLL